MKKKSKVKVNLALADSLMSIFGYKRVKVKGKNKKN